MQRINQQFKIVQRYTNKDSSFSDFHEITIKFKLLCVISALVSPNGILKIEIIIQ